MRNRRILVSLFALVIAIPTLSASAHPPAANHIPAEEDLVGLQTAVWRTYMPAGTFVGAGHYPLGEATPVSSPSAMSSLRSISIVVREFDSADHAAVAFGQINAGVEASMANVFSGGRQQITSKSLPDIGSQATLIRIDHTGQGGDVWLEYVIVQRDRYVIFVSAGASMFTMSGSEAVDTSLPTAEIAAAIAASGAPSPDAPAYSEEGASTGGLWGFMLPAGDPLLMGLVPVQDVIVYPNPGA